MASGNSRITLLLILMVSEIYGTDIQSTSMEANSVEEVMEELKGMMEIIQQDLKMEISNQSAMSQHQYDTLKSENERLKHQLNSIQRLLTGKENQPDHKIGGSETGQTAGVVVFMARHGGATVSPGNIIPFDIVDLNIGGAYIAAGVFIAPVAGIYQFSFLIQADYYCDTFIRAEFRVNNSVYTNIWASYNHPNVSSGGSSVIVQLAAGGNVTMNHHNGCGTYYYATGSNWFSGQLLYQIL